MMRNKNSSHFLFLAFFTLWVTVGCAADMGKSFTFVQCTIDVQCGEGMACGPMGQCISLRDPLEVPLGIEIL